jgi:hypothetical protein
MNPSSSPARKHSALHLRLAAILLALAILPAQAQFQVLKAFPESAFDGANPVGRGAIIGNQYFGTTKLGGLHGKGVLYRINLDGFGFAKLKDFTTADGSPAGSPWENSTTLLAFGNVLYGVSHDGENWGGILYSIDASGGNFQELFKFGEYLEWDSQTQKTLYSSQGYRPFLHFMDGNTIYGSCEWGTDSGKGSIFKINTDGSGFQELHVFRGGADGERPVQIVDGGNVIYGITSQGGIANKGTIFRINKDGSGYSLIRTMAGDVYLKSLAFWNGKLYVCSDEGGEKTKQMAYVDGFIFSINPDGSGYRHLKTFDGYSSSRKIDSLSRLDDPIQIGIHNNQIFGLATSGSSLKEKNLRGGLFRMNLDGTAYSRILAFNSLDKGPTGSYPTGFIIHNGVLYGTNSEGGAGGVGTLYSFNLGGSGGGTAPADPTPLTQEMFGTVSFTATEFFPQQGPSTTKASRGGDLLTEPARMARVPLTNATLLAKAVEQGLIPSAAGYSIVCPDTSESGLEFFAYKPGSALVSLAPILSLAEVSNVQAATTVTNSASGAVARSGTEKSYATGTILDIPVSVNRSISFKTGTVRLNGTAFTYYPSTSTASFFGGNEQGDRFLEGRFRISASKPIDVPAR